MTIETTRLTLRPFLLTDAADVYEYLQKPAVHCFTCMKLNTVEDAERELQQRIGDTEYDFAIVLKENGKVIGEINAAPESESPEENAPQDTFSPCWMLNTDYQGKGYAYEAAYAFYEYLFSQKSARRIYAYTEDDNLRSQHLCKKLGMRREGFFREFVSFVNKPDGTPLYENTIQYAILKREWEANKQSVPVSSDTSVTLAELTADDREQFILDNQYAFRYGMSTDCPHMEDEIDADGEIISRETIENSINGGVAYRIRKGGKNVGGLVLSFRGEVGMLELLFVSPDVHSKGIGYAAWQTVERLYPEIQTWETETPYFETRNIHFYVNKCGFHIVEFYNAKHPDPETDKEVQYRENDGMFRFEKRIFPKRFV